ncbi:MAG: menaquinone biosynthetic enzyme MqnA/MqnD family protein [Bacteroidia bacterium]|jgi:chorismate dehydratase
MTRIAIVNYLNTRPFIKGLELHGLLNHSDFEFQFHYPSQCANALLDGEADIGLVPVAVLKDLPSYQIIGNTCIGAEGPVQSVLLVSQIPLEHVKTVWLDYQSRSSVALCRILFREYWKFDVAFTPAAEGYLENLNQSDAAVVIGDRAFDARNKFNYVYDLAEIWNLHTGLPMVFAAWISLVPQNEAMVQRLNDAFLTGILHRKTAASEIQHLYNNRVDLAYYLGHSISYILDERMRLGLETFLNKMSNS